MRHDENFNNSTNPSFTDVLGSRLSRRDVLRAGMGTAGAAVLGSLPLVGCGSGGEEPAPDVPLTLGFPAVAKSRTDAVTVPAGYTATVIYALGDPLTSATADFKNDGTDTGFEQRAGDHHDGMQYFGLDAAGTERDTSGSERGLLAVNHEGITSQFLHVGGTTRNPRPADEADKEILAHGVSVVEVRKVNGKFAVQKDSPYNRRITPMTPMQLSGPVRGNALVKTKFSASGNDCRGTIGNCGTGYTPWGTLLTGEENWSDCFKRGDDEAARGGPMGQGSVSLRRYGVTKNSASVHGWETAGAADLYARWNITRTGTSPDGTDDYRNEANTFGYLVEIDPYDKNAALRKRTALGRFAHESAAFGKPTAGKPLAVYMGDDSRGEYIYKFVSAANWDASDASPADRIATGDKYDTHGFNSLENAGRGG